MSKAHSGEAGIVEYAARITREGKYVLAEFPDCPGCQTFADSEGTIEAVAQDALVGWLESNLGRDLVPPRPQAHAGRGGAAFRAIPVPASLAVRLELRWAREAAGLTQAQLAKRSGMSQQAVQKLESRKANPTIETLDRVARGLGGSVYVGFVQHAQPIIIRESNNSYGEGTFMAAKKGSNKVTSPKVASKASKLLRDGRTSATTKSVSGSAVSQSGGKKKPSGKRGL